MSRNSETQTGRTCEAERERQNKRRRIPKQRREKVVMMKGTLGMIRATTEQKRGCEGEVNSPWYASCCIAPGEYAGMGWRKSFVPSRTSPCLRIDAWVDGSSLEKLIRFIIISPTKPPRRAPSPTHKTSPYSSDHPPTPSRAPPHPPLVVRTSQQTPTNPHPHQYTHPPHHITERRNAPW